MTGSFCAVHLNVVPLAPSNVASSRVASIFFTRGAAITEAAKRRRQTAEDGADSIDFWKMTKKHLSLHPDQKKFTPAALKGYDIKAEGLGFDAQSLADRHGNVSAFDILFEGTFERARPGYWSGYYWDKVTYCGSSLQRDTVSSLPTAC